MQIDTLTRHVVLAITMVTTVCLGTVSAQTKDDPFVQSSADGIAAVVNKEVITLRNVETEIEAVNKNLKAQKIPVPPRDVLEKQVLQRLIDERLLLQEAAQMGLNPAEVDIDGAASMVAERNNITVTQLRAEIEKGGMTWDGYLKGLRQEVLMDQVRQRVIDPRINISDAEIDIFLKTQGIDPSSTKAASAAPSDLVELAQILVRVPEGSNAATQAELKKKAESLRQQAQQGADFAGLAAAASDASQALEGGNMGVRPLDGWPDAFAKAIENTATGQLSEIVRTGAGFHILKVLNRDRAQAAGSDQDLLVTQTHARHILIKTDKITSEQQAKERIDQIARRLNNGENFAELARAYSEDATAPQGGDLGWLHPGETVPAFEQMMDSLSIDQISVPVRTQFGWHLIQVEERRERNVGNEFRRMQARQILHEQRVEPALEDWLNQIRSQAFIDNRLDPQSSSRRRK